jgi:galactokinase
MSILEIFREVYRQDPDCIARAPGRIEVLGNHTDYNKGMVLSAAVGFHTEFAVKKNRESRFTIYDAKFKEKVDFSSDELELSNPGHWENYFKGLVREFSSRGVDIPAFSACILSSLPSGGGMSSSAALLLSAALALNYLFAGSAFSDEEIVLLTQKVENSFLGLNSGLLDQTTSMFGKKNHLLLCDFSSNKVETYLSIPDEFIFLAADSGVKHKLVDSEYNFLRKSCDEALKVIRKEFPKAGCLRDVSKSMLLDCRKKLPPVLFRKAEHVIDEIERVREAADLLKSRKISLFGKLMYKSHESSRYLFENSCPELDLLVELSQSIPDCLGARLSGGGFGGITIHLIRKENASLYAERLKTAFESMTGRNLKVYECSIGAGAGLIAD